VGLFQKKQATEGPSAAQRLAEQVETVRAIMRHYAPGMRLNFGAPTRCPECGDYGFVQGVNRGEGVSYNHCFGCQADWIISIEALRAYYADPQTPPAPPPASTVSASPWFAESMGLADVPPKPTIAMPVLHVPPPDPGTSLPPDTVPDTEPEPEPRTAGEPVAPVAPILASRKPLAARPLADEPPADEPSVEPVAAPADLTEATEPAAEASPTTAAPPDRPPRRLENPVLDSAMLAQLSRPGRVIEPTPPARLPSTEERVLRVIVAEDNPFDLAVLEELVEMADPRAVELISAATREEAERLAASAEHDLVLLDLELPDSSGITTLLEWQHSAVSAAPVIILSGSNDPGVISEARALGAVHFIQKDQLSGLADAGPAGADKLARLFRTTVRRATAQPRQ